MDDKIMEEQSLEQQQEEERFAQMVQALKGNAPAQDEKHNVHTFLNNVVFADDSTKLGNLRHNKELDELGNPDHHVRACKEMELIATEICDNKELATIFNKEAEITLATSLSDEGFLIKRATTETRQVADATRRRKINRGWFGKSTEESSGGDITNANNN
jgi:hypothetical protein